MIDKILDVGASMDFISPLWTMIQDIRHHPVEAFTIHISDMYDAQDAMRLRRIHTWGWLMYDRPWLAIHCKRSAAGLVALTLRQAGVPYTTSYRGRNR